MQVLRKTKLFLNWLSGYNFSNPHRNGEYHFLTNYLKNGMTVFDVGANIGKYTEFMLSQAPEIEVHCFEPVAETFVQLKKRHENNPQVRLNNFGLSNQEAIAHMKIYGETYGINSLYDRRSAVSAQNAYEDYIEQQVVLKVLDHYVAQHDIEKIDLLKIDVEGHELSVLKGAKESLASGVIKTIVFEYGSSFVDAQTSLQEVYDLVTQHGFQLYRLWNYGKWQIMSFEQLWGLENYQHSNWVAMI